MYLTYACKGVHVQKWCVYVYVFVRVLVCVCVCACVCACATFVLRYELCLMHARLRLCVCGANVLIRGSVGR